jgi:hypothetical protein
VYLLRVGVNQGDQSLGQVTRGVVVPYSPEYLTSGADRGLLEELARRTGGGELLEPLGAFVHNLPSVDLAREIWRPLLLLAALLFPLDVAVRRLAVSQSDLSSARSWIAERFTPSHGRSAQAEQPQLLGRLFEARQRARQRPSGEPEPEQTSSDRRSSASSADLEIEKGIKKATEQPDKKPPASPSSGYTQNEEPTPTENQTDSLARLREAKKRARRK